MASRSIPTAPSSDFNMNRQTILVTGGYGCIGAETAKWLLRNSDAAVVVCSRSVSDERTHRVFHDVDRERLTLVKADVTDQQAIEQILAKHQVTRVVHLAACKRRTAMLTGISACRSTWPAR